MTHWRLPVLQQINYGHHLKFSEIYSTWSPKYTFVETLQHRESGRISSKKKKKKMIYRFIDFLLLSIHKRKKPSWTSISNVMKILKSVRARTWVCMRALGIWRNQRAFPEIFYWCWIQASCYAYCSKICCLGEWRFLVFFRSLPYNTKLWVRKWHYSAVSWSVLLLLFVFHSAPTWTMLQELIESTIGHPQCKLSNELQVTTKYI